MPLRVAKYRGKRWIEDGKGGWRELGDGPTEGIAVDLPEPLAENVVAHQQAIKNPDFISNEPGTTFGQRFVLKNLAKTTEGAGAYLRGLGYEVRQYRQPGITDPFPFWVRKGPSDSWRPVDPPGAENPVEFIRDALDLTTDAVQGVLTTMAGAGGIAAGGPLGGIAAGGATLAATNYMRENAGAMAGIPQEPSISGAITEAIPGALMAGIPAPKPMMSAMGGVIPNLPPGPLARGAVQLSSKIAGTTPELMKERVRIKGFGALPTTDRAITNIRDLLKRFESDSERLPMRIEADEIIAQADKAGVRVDARPMFSAMNDFTLDVATGLPQTKEAARAYSSDARVPELLGGIMTRFRNRLDVEDIDPSDVPPAMMEDMKRVLQDIAAGKGGYVNTEMSKAGTEAIKSTASIARRQMEAALDATNIKGSVTAKGYSEVMADLDATMRSVAKARKGFYRGKTEIDQLKAAKGTMRMLYGDMAGAEYIDALADLDRRLGTGLKDEFKRLGVIHLREANLATTARQASLGTKYGESFGVGGAPNIVPRFTAQGKPIGQNFFSNYGGAGAVGGAGLLFGHPAAAAAGLVFASPRTQLAAMKLAGAISASSPSAISKTNQAVFSPQGRAALIGTIQGLQVKP